MTFRPRFTPMPALPDRRLKGGALDCLAAGLPGAVVNAGNDKGAPARPWPTCPAGRPARGLGEPRISWLGGAQCGLACDLITAAIYAPFELFMALPEWGEPDHSLLDMALRAGAKIFLSRDPELVLENAHAVYMGHGPEQCATAPLTSGWPLTDELLALAAEDAAVLSWHGLAPADRLRIPPCVVPRPSGRNGWRPAASWRPACTPWPVTACRSPHGQHLHAHRL